jgi:Zn-dependent protease
MNSALSNLIGPISGILYRIPAVIIAFTIHEFMHAYVAVKAGDNTPINQGRLTLNPVKHIDPIGFIMVILMGIGWAKPVQVNINNFRNKRKDFIMVSLAGVFGNLLIAFLLAAVVYFSGSALAANQIVFNLIYYTMYINLMLIWLNLLPIPPLDGFNVLTTLVRFKNMNLIFTLRRYGFIILIVLLITRVLSLYISGMTSLVLSGFYALFGLIQNLAGMV